MKIFCLIFCALAALMSSSMLSTSVTNHWASTASADELTDRDSFWRKQAFLCSVSAYPFPSKEVKGQPQDCDDGDMTLFNGLLCAAGEGAGCDAVARSQSADGRWWRSPRRIGMEAPANDVSFSPDQSLGVLLYVLQVGDKARFSSWLSWIEGNRPCLTKLGGKCFQYGWLRFCTDDFDKRCTLRPGDCVRLEEVARRLGVDSSLCRRILRELGLPTDVMRPLGDFLLGAAAANDPGYPQHLVGVDILIARMLGVDATKVNQAAAILAARTADNPFFQYLSGGAADDVRAKLLLTCPSPQRLSGNRFQWTWERVAKPNAWQESMYWDCIFLGDLTRK
ncbi:hypothetical protein [Mesorhizobium sp. M0296]|uniref:hypothetical protein n=1 Tax=Mesorhizobium sp. M0296 TaxID=2956931 RepID=UPI00333A54ED